MKTLFGEKLVKCPVCKKEFLESGIKNHIINSAKSEVWNKKKNKPHSDFYWKNCKTLRSNKNNKLSFIRINISK
jgi:uncharacterized C2H2 Zn-finger protein